MDIGRYNARVATFEESTGQAVCAHNSDGHRTTKMLLDDNDNAVGVDNLSTFIQEKLIPLATDAAHTKAVHIVASVPIIENNGSQNFTNVVVPVSFPRQWQYVSHMAWKKRRNRINAC
jgi:hypothetical protein